MRKYTIEVKQQNNTAVYYAIIITAALTVVLLSNEPTPTRINTTPASDYIHTEYHMPIYEGQNISGKRMQDTTAVYEFVNNYPGSRLTGEYLDLLNAECNGDIGLLKQLVAIATAETAQGRETSLKNNYWGWHAGGDTKHDPDRKTMAREIVQGISAYYSDVGNSEAIANIYTGGDSTSTWLEIYQWSINEMAD